MALLGAFLGNAVVLLSSGAVGFILGGPVGAGIAMSQATVAANAAGLVGVLAPL